MQEKYYQAMTNKRKISWMCWVFFQNNVKIKKRNSLSAQKVTHAHNELYRLAGVTDVDATKLSKIRESSFFPSSVNHVSTDIELLRDNLPSIFFFVLEPLSRKRQKNGKVQLRKEFQLKKNNKKKKLILSNRSNCLNVVCLENTYVSLFFMVP